MFAWARALGSGGSSPRVAGALLRQALCKRTGVLVVELCDERRLNAFTIPMIEQLCAALSHAACSDAVRGVVVTGRGRYYSAGADLSSVLTFRRPSHLVSQLRDTNQGLFDSFIKFPKPIVAAVNGPAFGAAVTSATLMDAVVASETATFSLPFAKYGVPPEGCSSVVLKELIGEECAIRMMGTENWAPTAFEVRLPSHKFFLALN
ncbi:hypothetical protein AB1Y20_019402 [Prymnesium parvum]|uniref:3-hydroxyisobutyryl-CoA hydrolase n=1 Tax=Prymnesium parvum TaxID=97485 RepID=A0AB34JR42_PRYPA